MTMADWHPESGLIDVELRDGVAVITLRRPEKLNALTAPMRRDLSAAVRHYGTGDAARGIVLTGAGRAFSAGEDLRDASALPPGGLAEEAEQFHDITRAVLQTRVPVVAAVNGIAVGGACEITMCCDARIGAATADMYLPENGIGLSISNASSFLLPRLVGAARAVRLVLDAARLSAPQALVIGLLDEVVDDPVAAAVALVRRWTEPGTATAVHLLLLRPPLELIEQAFAAETQAAWEVDASGLAKVGIRRFVERA
jgi:enoyl-CoA hydratase